MATTVYGESNTTGGGNAYRYITAVYAANAVQGPAFGNFAGVANPRGYAAIQAGSLVGVSFSIGTSSSTTTDLQIYKNRTKWITPFAAVNSNSTAQSYYGISYAIGANTYAANDYFDVYLTSTATLYFGVTLVFAEPGP